MTRVTDAAGLIWLVKLRLEESRRALLAAQRQQRQRLVNVEITVKEN